MRRTYKYRVKSTRLPEELNEPFFILIQAENEQHADMIAAEIGLKHHMLLTFWN